MADKGKYSSVRSPGIPWLRGRDGRFCPYCGRAISNYFRRDRCPHSACFRVLPTAQPDLPSHLQWCPSCHVVALSRYQNFCIQCRYTTPLGKKWLQIVNEGRRKVEEEQQKIKAQLDAIMETADASSSTGISTVGSATAGSSAAAVRADVTPATPEIVLGRLPAPIAPIPASSQASSSGLGCSTSYGYTAPAPTPETVDLDDDDDEFVQEAEKLFQSMESKKTEVVVKIEQEDGWMSDETDKMQ